MLWGMFAFRIQVPSFLGLSIWIFCWSRLTAFLIRRGGSNFEEATFPSLTPTTIFPVLPLRHSSHPQHRSIKVQGSFLLPWKWDNFHVYAGQIYSVKKKTHFNSPYWKYDHLNRCRKSRLQQSHSHFWKGKNKLCKLGTEGGFKKKTKKTKPTGNIIFNDESLSAFSLSKWDKVKMFTLTISIPYYTS